MASNVLRLSRSMQPDCIRVVTEGDTHDGGIVQPSRWPFNPILGPVVPANAGE